MSTIAFSIPSALEVQQSLTLSGLFIAPTGTNRLRVGGDFTLNLADSGNLAAQIATAAGVLSFNTATGAVTLTSAAGYANYVGVSNSGTTIYVSGAATPNLSGVTFAGGAKLTGDGGNLYAVTTLLQISGGVFAVSGAFGTTTPLERFQVSGGRALINNTLTVGNDHSAPTTPLGMLDVQTFIHATTPSGIVARRNASQYLHLHELDGSAHVIEGVGDKPIRIANRATSPGIDTLHLYGNNAGTLMAVVTFSGNVGIGTAVPSARLHVSGGDLRVDGSGSIVGTLTLGSGVILGTSNTTGGGINWPDVAVYRRAANTLSFWANGVNSHDFGNNGSNSYLQFQTNAGLITNLTAIRNAASTDMTVGGGGGATTSNTIIDTAGAGVLQFKQSGVAMVGFDTLGRMSVLSGLYLKQTGDYTASGVASVAQLIALSGLDAATYCPTGGPAGDFTIPGALSLNGTLSTNVIPTTTASVRLGRISPTVRQFTSVTSQKLESDGDLTITTNSNGNISMTCGGEISITASKPVNFGTNGITTDHAARTLVPAATGTRLDGDIQSFTSFDNLAATSLVEAYLPFSTASIGNTFTFTVNNANGFRVRASGGDLIAYNGTVSSGNAYIESSTLYSSLTLLRVRHTGSVTGVWATAGANGTWTLV